MPRSPAPGFALDPAVRQAVLFQVTLVGFLGPVERGGGCDLRDDRALVPPALLAVLFRGDRHPLLLGGPEEDGGAILLAHVRPLSVQGRRVVVFPEDVQELLVGDLRRVVLDLHGLGVARSSRTDTLVRRVLRAPPRIADGGFEDALDLPERRLHAPETTRRETGFGHGFSSLSQGFRPVTARAERIFSGFRPRRSLSKQAAERF